MKINRFMLAGRDKQNKDDDDDDDAREDSTWSSLVACFTKERCPICLNFIRKDVAFPENCYHAFCFTCILKWSETSTSCPVDRKPFQAILKIDKVVGCTKIPVKMTIATESRERYCCDRKQCCSVGIENDKIYFRADAAKEVPLHNCKDSTYEKKRCISEEQLDLKLKIKRLSWSSACCSGGNPDIYPPANPSGTPNHVSSGSYLPQDSEINLIQMKRDELRYFRTPAFARQTQCNTPLSTETETLILPSFTFVDHIFPLNHFSSRNQDFSKRTCAHSGTQEGTEKKRVAGASNTRGTRKKPVQSSTRRRSTRNSKTEDASQLQSSPKSSNSDHSATGCNSSSTNAESSENIVKSPPKQRKRPKKRPLVRKRLRSNTHTQGESDESKENSGSESEQSFQKSKISRESSTEMGHTDTDTSADHVAEMCEHHMDEQSSDIPVSDTDKQFAEHNPLSPQIESSDKIQYSPDFQNDGSIDKDIASPGLNNGQHLGAEPDLSSSTEQIVLSQSATSQKKLDSAMDTGLCSDWLHLEGNNYPSTAETEKSQNSQQSIDFTSEQSDGEDLEQKLHSASSASDTILESENATVLPVMSPEKVHEPEVNDSTVYVRDSLQCKKEDSDGTHLSVNDSIVIKPSDFPISHNGHNAPPSLENTEKQEQSEVGIFANLMSKETHFVAEQSDLEATCESSEMQSCSESLIQDKLITTKPGDDMASCFSEHKECFGKETSTANLPQEHKDKPYFDSINVTELPEQASFAFPQMHVKGDDCEKQVNADMQNGNTMHEHFGSTINTGTDLEAHKLHLHVNENGDKSDLNLEQGNVCIDDKSASDFVSRDEKQCEINSMHKVMDKETLKSESDSQVSEKEDKTNVQKTESGEVNEKLKKETRTRKSRFHSPSTTWSPSKTDIKDRPRSRSRSKVRDSPAKRRSRTRSRERERDRVGQWKGRSRDHRHRRQSRSRSKSHSRSRSGSRPRNRSRFSAPDRNSDSHSPHWKDRQSHENWRGSRGHERHRRSDNEKPNEHLRRNEQYKSNEYSRRNEQAKYNERLHRSETEKRWNESEKHSDHFRRIESEKTAANLQLNELEQNNDHFAKNEADVPTDHSLLKDPEKATKHNESQNMNNEQILQNESENRQQDESDMPSIPFQKNESEKPNDHFQQEPKYNNNSLWQAEPEQHSESVQCNESEKAIFFHHSEPENSGNPFQRNEPERPSNSFWKNEHEKSSDNFLWNEPDKNRSNFWRNESEKPDNPCWPDEPDLPNEQFRNEKHNMSRERSDQYHGNKNNYPDWMAENNKSTEKRGRGANRSRGYTRGSSWSDNPYHSGDSWNRNMNSEWRAPRGRGGRGRGGFHGGLNFGDQNENRWNSRPLFSGNSPNFGPEPSGLMENRNFRPKYEQEPPNPPADRSGWSSASSWAVRKTLPADVQSYYSKRGKNNAGTQPGWSRQEVSQDQDQTIKDPASQQAETSQVPINIVQPQVNVVQQQMNPPPQQPMNIFPYPVGIHPPMVNIQHNPFNIPPQLPMHLHPGLPIVQVTASTAVPQGLPPPPPPPPPAQQINYITSQQDGKHVQVNPSATHVSSNLSAPLLPALTAPQGIAGTILGPNVGSVATSSHLVKVSARKESISVEATADSSKKEKRLQMQERAAQEVKIAIKPFYQNKDITKDEYKEIVKKAVDKVCHSKSGEVDSSKVANLIKAYVDKYKHSRKKGD